MNTSTTCLETLRAFVARDLDEYDRLMEQLSPEVLKNEYTAVVAAGFIVAVQELFGQDASKEDVISLVADLRSRSVDVASNLDPRSAERLVLAVTHGENVDDLDDKTVVSYELALAAAIVNDMISEKCGVDEFIQKVERFIEENS